MSRFRKRPIEVEAVQWDGTDAAWEAISDLANNEHRIHRGAWCLTILTPKGEMLAGDGDWVVKGLKGEIYPVTPDIFEALYEPIA